MSSQNTPPSDAPSGENCSKEAVVVEKKSSHLEVVNSQESHPEQSQAPRNSLSSKQEEGEMMSKLGESKTLTSWKPVDDFSFGIAYNGTYNAQKSALSFPRTQISIHHPGIPFSNAGSIIDEATVSAQNGYLHASRDIKTTSAINVRSLDG